jgi:hypothetical protein
LWKANIVERYQGITVRLKTMALAFLLGVLDSHAGAQEALKEQLITLPTRWIHF